MDQAELDSLLVRGAKLRVRSTFRKGNLSGDAEVTVASKTPVVCNGGWRCAHDNCVGLAVFVGLAEKIDPTDPGWLKNTVKVCLTHLEDLHGRSLAPAIVREDHDVEEPMAEATPTNGAGISWEKLALAAQAEDREQIVTAARVLKMENERLRADLIESQKAQIRLLQEKLAASN